MDHFEFPEQLDLAAFMSKEAHDLRSPFNRILGFTKMVLKGMDGPLTDLQREDLNTVLQNSLQATMMMSNLVDIARLSRGEKSFHPEPAELNNLFSGAIGLWKQNHPWLEVVFEKVVFAPLVPVQVDEGLMRQALMCWLAYVMEHTKAPEKVTLRAEDGGSELLITIQCQGSKAPGPSECTLTMWSYIGQRIVQMHKGEMRGGELGEGSVAVRFTLPKALLPGE